MRRALYCVMMGVLGLGSLWAEAGLRAGYAKIDVTPSGPVWLGGYDLRNTPSDGVYPGEKLYVRALVYESGGLKVAFVEADIIMARDHDRVRANIASATGIAASNILFGDVHNHAAPSPDSKRNGEWTRQFDAAVIEAVKRAAAGVEPVRVAAGQGRSRIAMNRRAVRTADADSNLTFDENARSQSFGEFKTDRPALLHEFEGDMRLGANPGGPIDDAVQLVRIDGAKGPLALMIHYPCHGTTLGGRNSKVSGEWMGRMQDYVERQFPGLGSIYVQGAAGDINPRVVGGLDGNRDDIEAVHRLGEEIGREVVRVYRGLKPEEVAGARIRIASQDILLPRAYQELFKDFRRPAVHAPTTVIRIGDLMWVTFPGEMFHAIGKFVKSACPAPYAHLAGYVNGYIGYFPEQQAFAEGGYEPATSHLAPNAEQVYKRAISAMLRAFE